MTEEKKEAVENIKENINMKLYSAVCTPPDDALRTIQFGALKGKNDINPQWRYEALTNNLGPCGVGWKFEIANTQVVPIPATGETMIYIMVNLYWKDGDNWSAPIPGWGGDYLIKKDKNGLHGNDEAYKMAATDALGTAAKMLGVAADVYRGKLDGISDSKYANRQQWQGGYSHQQPQQARQARQPQSVSDYYNMVLQWAKKNGAVNLIPELLFEQFKKRRFSELSLLEAKAFWQHLPTLVAEIRKQERQAHERGVIDEMES